MAASAVELRSVSKRFPAPGGGEVLAVDNMQLDIEEGIFFSFLGPSGCGKTTTLRMIGGRFFFIGAIQAIDQQTANDACDTRAEHLEQGERPAQK